MRRGMMDWQPEEVPAQLLSSRVQQVAAQCKSEGLAAMVFYANFTRPMDVSLLTHFVPFWSQALLAITATGRSALVMATTGRTVQWIRSTSVVEHVAVGSQIGQVLADWIAQESEAPSGTPYGVVHPDEVPQLLLDQLQQRLAPARPLDMSTWWDPTSSAWSTPLAVAQQARYIAQAALDAVAQAPHDTGHSIVAAADGTCRSLGAEEVAVLVAPDLARSDPLRRLEGDARLGTRVAVQVTVAYKGHWLRQTRSFDRQGDRLVAMPHCQEADAALARSSAARHPPAYTAAAVAQALGAELSDWALEGPVRGLPLDTLASSRSASVLQEPAMLEASLTLRLRSPSGAVLWGAPLPRTPFTATL
jgi:hypothetical protein